MCFEKLAETERILQEIITNLMFKKEKVLVFFPPFV